MAEISTELDQLSIALIQTAIDMLDAGDDIPVMLACDCESELLTFEDDTPDGCYRAACEHVASLGAACTRYALLYDGVVQEAEDDPGSEALLFEFGERGMENAWSGYMLYRRADDGAIEVTDPYPAGEEMLLLAG
jgi:hypothetical protein